MCASLASLCSYLKGSWYLGESRTRKGSPRGSDCCVSMQEIQLVLDGRWGCYLVPLAGTYR